MSNQQCDGFPMFRYTWPGRDEALICVQHAFEMQRVAEVMGFHLQFIRLDVDRDVVGECSQKVPEYEGETDDE